MADPTPARRRNMAAIKGKNTLPERRLRSALFALGLRFRLHSQRLPGTPDLVFPKFRAVVFVHGCFWHRHGGCRFAAAPKNNAEFWEVKFAANQRRDAASLMNLHAQGWRVGVVWECAIRESTEQAAAKLAAWLEAQDRGDAEIGSPMRSHT